MRNQCHKLFERIRDHFRKISMFGRFRTVIARVGEIWRNTGRFSLNESKLKHKKR